MATDPLAFLDQSQEPAISAQKTKSDPLSFLEQAEEPSRTRSLLSALPKGLIKGARQLGTLHDPLSAFFGASKAEQEAVERVLPTQKGRGLEQFLETAGEMVPQFALGPESLGLKVAQVGSGALAKQFLKDLDTPELVQEIGSAVASLSPQAIKGTLSKKLMPSKVQKEAYDLLKGHGFSDKQITPFIQNKKKATILAKWGQPFLNREKLAGNLDSIGERAYGAIKEKGKSIKPLEGVRRTAFLQQFDKQTADIPYFHRDLIANDIDRLKSGPLTWNKLRDFELAINNKIKGAEGGKAVLGTLKDSINLGERLLSPELFKEKQIVNKIYSSGKNIIDKLPEDSLTKYITNADKMGVIGSLATSFVMGNPVMWKSFALKKGSELAAARLISSPRFQNMRLKLAKAITNDNTGVALNLVTKLTEQLDKFTKENDQEKQ